MVFDKTGTLTEDGLQILGVRGMDGDVQEKPVFRGFETKVTELVHDYKHKSLQVLQKLKCWLLTEAMASCQSVTYIENKPIGDPLEIQMFESTDWAFSEPSEGKTNTLQDEPYLASVRPKLCDSTGSKYSSDPSGFSTENAYELKILRRFDFESRLQRMSVIVR